MQRLYSWYLLIAILVATLISQNDAKDDKSQKQFIGCFVDEENRDLSAKFVSDDKMTVKKCQDICSGYKYYSVQYGIQCFCGNSYGKYGNAVATAECDYHCGGDSNEICGGFWRNSVYRAQELVGCFVDKEDRDLDAKFVSDEKMTSKKCQDICNGYKYYSVQYSVQCFCGNSYGKYGNAVAAAECNYRCGGDNNEMCGGFWRNSVYRTPQKVVGCFVDKEDRDLSAKFVSDDKMTSRKCQDICSGYKYYSVQYSVQCFCGNSYGKYGKAVATTECDYRCGGDNNEICGGFWRNSVYRAHDTQELVGCFVDKEDRDLSAKFVSDEKMTSKKCQDICNGYKYYSVQYSVQCFCGDSYGKYGAVAATECNYRCGGDNNEMCGGFWRNSVYKY